MKIKLLFCFCFFYLLPFYAKSADPEIDSLNTLIDNLGSKDPLRVVEEINREAERNGNVKFMVWCQSMMMNMAYDKGNFEEVLKIGYHFKKETLAFKNNSFTAHLLTTMGLSYSKLGFNEEARRYFQQATLYAQKIIDSDNRRYRLGLIYIGLAINLESVKEKSDSVLYYFTKGYAELQFFKNNDRYKADLRMSQSNLAAWYLNTKQYDSSKKYLDLMAMNSPKSKPDKVEMFRLANLASYYAGIGDFKRSIADFHKALILGDSLHAPYLKKFVFKSLSEIYARLNDNVKVKLYQKKYLVIADSLAKEEKNAIRTPLANLLNDSKTNNENKLGFYTIVILIVISLLFISIYIGFVFFKKYKKEQITSSELAQLIEEKMLQLEILNKIPDKDREEELRKIIQLAIANDPVFFVQFHKFDQKFLEKIIAIAPTILASELEFCALLRLNFETKEIARYTGLSVRAVEGKKYRVRKKLQVPSEEDLNVWMTTL